jgi:predicted permease
MYRFGARRPSTLRMRFAMTDPFAGVRRFLRRLIGTLRRGRRDADAAREIASHLALLEDDFARRGMTEDDARHAARRALGSTALTLDRHRDARSFVWLEDLRWDLVYAARLLRVNPAFSLTAAISLAIGIGANTAVFTVADALLFRTPDGVARPDRLVDIGRTVRRGGAFNPGSYPDYLDFRARATTLDGVYASAMFPHPIGFAVDGGAAEQVFALAVSMNYFGVLGVAPEAGRLFGDGDSEAPGASPVVVVSHEFWTRRFEKSPSTVGRAVFVDGRPFTIVGVTPEGFHGTGVRATDVWIPITMTATANGTSALTNRAAAVVIMGSRLKPGVGVGAAAAEAAAIAAALAREHPDENRDKGLAVLAASPVPGNAGPIAVFLALLMALVAAVLVVACANVASVLLARAAARRREIAVRLAIGAGRARLARQLITETLLLFAIGGAAGLFLARVLTSVAIAALPALPFPIAIDLTLDHRAIAFTTALSLLAALACGLVPALQTSRTDSVAGLRDDAAGAAAPRVRNAFLVAQVAFSLVLVVVAGLFARALEAVGSRHPGFDTSGVEIASIDLATAGYTDTTAPLFAREVIERVRRLPGVESATIAAALPSGFERMTLAGLRADADAAGAPLASADWNVVEPGYFSTLKMALVAGRDFSAGDTASSQRVAIIGTGAARRFFPNGNAVGGYLVQQRFAPRSQPPTPPEPLLVVGVAADPTYGTLVDGMSGLYVYVPLQQRYMPRFTNIVVRTAAGQTASSSVRTAIRSMNANVPVGAARPARDVTALGLLPQRIVASAAGSLGLVGLLLAAVGLYGVTAYNAARRTREFGVRIALGATRGDIARLVLGRAVALTIAGAIVGFMTAAGAATLSASLLFGVAPLDPPTFAGAALLLVVVGAAACYVPAARATRIDPVGALRHE